MLGLAALALGGGLVYLASREQHPVGQPQPTTPTLANARSLIAAAEGASVRASPVERQVLAQQLNLASNRFSFLPTNQANEQALSELSAAATRILSGTPALPTATEQPMSAEDAQFLIHATEEQAALLPPERRAVLAVELVRVANLPGTDPAVRQALLTSAARITLSAGGGALPLPPRV